MKIFKYGFFIAFIAIVASLGACKDETLNPVPEFESGLVAVGDTLSLATRSFSQATPSKNPSFRWRWFSFDKKLTCTKAEIYVTFREPYRDSLNNSLTADHGTKLWKTIQGSEVPANYAWKSFEITSAEIYNFYRNNTFNYRNGRGTVSVFANPVKTARTATTPLLATDVVRVTWIIYDANGLKFDSWSFNVCTDANFLPDSQGRIVPVTNCQYDIPVGN